MIVKDVTASEMKRATVTDIEPGTPSSEVTAMVCRTLGLSPVAYDARVHWYTEHQAVVTLTRKL